MISQKMKSRNLLIIIFFEKQIRDFLFTSKLHMYIAQNSFHFDEIFHRKFQNSNFGLCGTKTTSSGNFEVFLPY